MIANSHKANNATIQSQTGVLQNNIPNWPPLGFSQGE